MDRSRMAAVAEMTKLLENIYRCVNIALVNELKLLCMRLGVGIWEVIDGVNQALLVSRPFTRPWARRSLHSCGTVLSFLEGQTARFSAYPIHRVSE